jgi:hypothetical protein
MKVGIIGIKKTHIMKKIFMLLALTIGINACYEDYVRDFDFSGVYFPYQVDVRTLVVGEGMKIEIGVALGGVRENTIDRKVNFMLDNSLVTPAILAAMNTSVSYIKDAVSGISSQSPVPQNYYSLSSYNEIIIKAGQHVGIIELTADSANFLADVLTLKAKYVIPLLITGAEKDSVNQKKNYSVIGLKYENMLFGNYYHGGVTTIKDVSGNVVNVKTYRTTLPQADNKIWIMTTVGPSDLTVNGYSDQVTTKAQMKLTLNGSNITISSVAGAAKVIQPDGASSYNQSRLLQNRKLFLKYKFDNGDGTTSYVQDTLTFRNRLRDGVNEWQDEDPSHY